MAVGPNSTKSPRYITATRSVTLEPVRYFFEVAPEITVIWAHAGIPAPPYVVRPADPALISEMLDTYPRLYADTSLRTPFILSGDGIDLAEQEQQWLVDTFIWAAENFDLNFFTKHSQIILPTVEFFPALQRFGYEYAPALLVQQGMKSRLHKSLQPITYQP